VGERGKGVKCHKVSATQRERGSKKNFFDHKGKNKTQGKYELGQKTQWLQKGVCGKRGGGSGEGFSQNAGIWGSKSSWG